MISLKGVSFVVVLTGVGLGRIDAVAGLAFIGAMLGLREYTKVKMNGFVPKGNIVVDPEGGEA